MVRLRTIGRSPARDRGAGQCRLTKTADEGGMLVSDKDRCTLVEANDREGVRLDAARPEMRGA